MAHQYENEEKMYDGGVWLPDPEWLRPVDTEEDDEEQEETPQDGIWLPDPDWLRPVEEKEDVGPEDGEEENR